MKKRGELAAALALLAAASALCLKLMKDVGQRLNAAQQPEDEDFNEEDMFAD